MRVLHSVMLAGVETQFLYRLNMSSSSRSVHNGRASRGAPANSHVIAAHRDLLWLHVTEWSIAVVAPSAQKSTRAKVGERRARLRAEGLRPLQIWTPDVRTPAFRSDAHRQSLSVAASADAASDQAFIDAVSD
jgi:hypothetical protein